MLAQEIEAVLNRGEVGFRRGEFQSSVAQKLRHKQFDLVFQEVIRTARNDEIVAIADQIHLGALGAFGIGRVVGFEQFFESVQSQVCDHR
jgi:hypothetical protein